MPRVSGGRQIRRASRDEPALQGEVSHPSEGSNRKSDNRASKAVGSTPGDLCGVSARTRQNSPLSPKGFRLPPVSDYQWLAERDPLSKRSASTLASTFRSQQRTLRTYVPLTGSRPSRLAPSINGRRSRRK